MTSYHLSPKTVEALRLFHDGAEELAVVENNGIRLDMEYLEFMIGDLGRQIAALTATLKKDSIWRLWVRKYGQKAELGSREQLSNVLFVEMGLPVPAGTRRVKKGHYAADEETLEKVGHPWVIQYLQLTKLNKLLSTYFEGIKKEQVGGYLRVFYNLHKARSFRSSSDHVNFQNIPSRHPVYSPMIRKLFIPRDGNHLVELDFSGAEVRVAGCVTKDPKLMAYLAGSGDMHHDVAKDIFLLTDAQVDKKTTRHWAKNRFVFAQFYGSVWFQCAPALWDEVTSSGGATAFLKGTQTTVRDHLKSKGITELGSCDPGDPPKKGTFAYQVMQAETVMWTKRFTVYSQWKKDLWREYQETGYIDMPTGFTIDLSDLRRNQVLNFKIQGSAFHCLLWCLINAQREMRRYKMRTKILGQIHDSVLSDVPDRELQNYLEIMHRTMTKDIMKAWKWLIVPLEAEADVAPLGRSWAEKQGWHAVNGIWQKA